MNCVYCEGQKVVFTNADGNEPQTWHPAIGTIGTVVNNDDSEDCECVKVLWPKGAVSANTEALHPDGVFTYKSKLSPYFSSIISE